MISFILFKTVTSLSRSFTWRICSSSGEICLVGEPCREAGREPLLLRRALGVELADPRLLRCAAFLSKATPFSEGRGLPFPCQPLHVLFCCPVLDVATRYTPARLAGEPGSNRPGSPPVDLLRVIFVSFRVVSDTRWRRSASLGVLLCLLGDGATSSYELQSERGRGVLTAGMERSAN